MDRNGQHVVPHTKVEVGAQAEFSENNAAALAVVRTEGNKSNVSTWLSRDRDLPLPKPTQNHQPLPQQVYSHASQHAYMYQHVYAPDPQRTQQQALWEARPAHPRQDLAGQW